MSNFVTLPESSDTFASDYLLVRQGSSAVKMTRSTIAGGIAEDLNLGVFNLNGNTTTNVNLNYYITGSYNITLPIVTSLVVGDRITFTKDLQAEPTIEVDGTEGEVIETTLGNDTSVTFDINSEIIFIFNGINWEV